MHWLIRQRPTRLPFRRYVARAAVALIYRVNDQGGEELLFIQRAHRPGDPWSGDMAFPGGRLQADDGSTRGAAVRETLEETGLDLVQFGRYERRLADVLTRHHNRWRPMVVSPYVFSWQGPAEVALNHEVQKVVWVPLDYLRNPAHRSIRPWQTPLGELRLPCYRYQGHCIWGLSYSMLQDFLANQRAADKKKAG
ncbi:MAG: CoA pyrophosphatase [Marinobacter sp.]|nr:CoA pyrophosphatase [Marinobacter sp.]